MTARIGTSHFRSVGEARKAYGYTYDDALAEGRIAIGRPDTKPGDRLLVDNFGRYLIERPTPGEVPKAESVEAPTATLLPVGTVPTRAEAGELLPCPFCGSAAHLNYDKMGLATNATAHCIASDCHADVWSPEGKDAAGAMWNKRTPNGWEQAVWDACAVACIDPIPTDPRTTIERLISWHVEMALDPEVSGRAQVVGTVPKDQEFHIIPGNGLFGGIKVPVDPTLPPNTVAIKGEEGYQFQLHIKTGDTILTQTATVTKVMPVPQPDSVWQHRSGNLYTVLLVSNAGADRTADFPTTVVYRSEDGRVWSRPLEKFRESMARMIRVPE